jgi:hypothetical protein
VTPSLCACTAFKLASRIEMYRCNGDRQRLRCGRLSACPDQVVMPTLSFTTAAPMAIQECRIKLAQPPRVSGERGLTMNGQNGPVTPYRRASRPCAVSSPSSGRWHPRHPRRPGRPHRRSDPGRRRRSSRPALNNGVIAKEIGLEIKELRREMKNIKERAHV